MKIECYFLSKSTILRPTLRKKRPHLEFSGPYLTVFSANAGKDGPEKLRIRTLYTQCKSTIQPILHSSQPIGLQTFCKLAKIYYNPTFVVVGFTISS